MNSLWNFDNGFPIQDPQFNDSPWVPVMEQQQQQQSNWPELGSVSSGYLHEIPNPNAVPAEEFFGFDFDFGQHKENSVQVIDLGIGNEGCYPNGSLSDILVSGDAGFSPAKEQNLKRSIAPETPILDLNFPADASVWPEFDSEPILMLPSQSSNPGSSLVTGDYSGGMTLQVIEDLNLTPVKEIENPLPVTTPVQFAPETPDHQAQLERQELNTILISLIDETEDDRVIDKGKTVVNSSSDELLQNIVDPYMQKEVINGSITEEAAFDLNKTPNQKPAAPKRRKYTPKVIKENKPKRGRKSATTPKPPKAAAETPPKSAKRKYVRKERTEAEATPPPAQQAEGNMNMNTQEQAKSGGRSVQGLQNAKRALNFDLEDVMEANSAIRVPQVSNLYSRNTVPYAQNRQQGGGTLEDAVHESSVLRNQNLNNINLTPQVPGPYSSSIPPVQMNPQLHASVSRQSGIPNQQRTELGNLRFHTGTIVGMGRTAFPQQCNNPGEGFQGRLTNLNNAVNSRQALLDIVSRAMLNRVRGNQPPSSEQQQRPPLNPSGVWQRMLSTFPAAHQCMNVQQHIAGRTDLPSQGRSNSAANDADWGESGIFRNGFLQAMAEAECLGQQHNLYVQQQQQLSAPSRNETSVVTQLQDTAPMSHANRAEPVTPEKIEKLKNQSAAQVNKRGRKRLDLSNPEPINPTNNVQKGQRGRPPKIQPSVSDTRVPCTASNYTSMVNQLTNRIAALDLSIEAGAIVPYMGGDGAVVPYDARKRKLRPKVDLDPETSRVWNVLMGKEPSDEHEDKDLKKEKWWQTEREVFRGRAESFIARMHQVQGDRRFSRWKGSVVDSVIGVFLTQNVSDHLSSSAFMALVAAFPAKSRDPSHDNSKSIIVEEPEDFMSNANKVQPEFSFELNRSPMEVHSIIWRDCFSSPTERTTILEAQSHSTEEEGISSQGSCVTPLEDLCHKSEGINDSTSKAYQVSENGSSQSNYEGCEQTDLAGQKQVELVDGFSDGFYPPGFENQHFPVPSVSSNLHHLEMNLKMTTVEAYDDESASTSSKRPRVAETMQAGNTQVPHNSTTGGSHPERKNNLEGTTTVKAKGKKALVEEKTDWDKLRRDVRAEGRTSERSSDAMDTLDYETIRKTPVEKISNTIRARGMNNMLAERIKDFLDRLVEDHGSVDLEWLRDVPPDMAKDYLLSIRGLGLKSVECVRLLTLHNLAFPVDTNVGRIAVRLGWVPLEPLPEALQIHLLEVYPLLESVQKYLWPRLCKLDQRTLYELHYQLITFGKVFCTKTKPNCNACPMRGDCRHFASAFASAKLALPGPEEKKIVSCDVPLAESGPHISVKPTSIHRIEAQEDPASSFSVLINSVQPYHMEDKATDQQQGTGEKTYVEPIIEEPASPEPDVSAVLEHDIEDWYIEDDEDEIPTINLNMEAFTKNLERVIQENNGDLDGPSMSRALVALDPRLSSLPSPQLKNISRLRTEHHVYELPDDHYLLLGMQRREVDDPSPYLLAIWAPGETKDSTQLPESTCRLQAAGNMCNDQTCFSCNSMREDELQVVRGTILIPCRTAMKGSFPLNGTYFQVNEMFADHESSHNPINVPRHSIWNLRRRIVYFGTSVTSIFRGLTTEQIQHCFWRGFVCVRAFDRLSGAPRPLVKRLHQVASKAKPNEEE